MESPAGFLVAFSSAPNIVASDGQGPYRRLCDRVGRNDPSARPAARRGLRPHAPAHARGHERPAEFPGIRPISAMPPSRSSSRWRARTGRWCARCAGSRMSRPRKPMPSPSSATRSRATRTSCAAIPITVSPAASRRFLPPGARPLSGAARWRATRGRPTGPPARLPNGPRAPDSRRRLARLSAPLCAACRLRRDGLRGPAAAAARDRARRGGRGRDRHPRCAAPPRCRPIFAAVG